MFMHVLPVSSFGLSSFFHTFHDTLLRATGSILQSQITMLATLQARVAAMDTLTASMMPWSLLQGQTITHAMGSLLQSQTITHAMLQTEATVVSAAILLCFLFCVVAMLQSRLARAAGH